MQCFINSIQRVFFDHVCGFSALQHSKSRTLVFWVDADFLCFTQRSLSLFLTTNLLDERQFLC